MKHDDYRDLLLYSASGGIDDDDQAVLERHLQTCETCRREYEEARILHRALIEHRAGVAADDRLLNEARQELRIALRNEVLRRSSWMAWLRPGEYSPAARFALGAACTLALGFFLGRSLFLPAAVQETLPVAPVSSSGGERPEEGRTRITNVHFVDHGGGTGEIEFTFDAVTPVRMRGSIDDPKIQKVLTHAMLNEENPGVRLQAVHAINRQDVESQDRETKSALIKALAADANAGVRKEALHALRRLPFDAEIKRALLRTLVSDGNPGLRIAAINALDSARTSARGVDGDMLSVLRQKAETDDNNYIRVKARAVIQEATGK
ncbi:MAG TPA: HEAT repeat domain-containing protein [Bacteroidota bacterium]|nr:HEAT repeat domain-containing protein [Bacteroidota bacterium]